MKKPTAEQLAAAAWSAAAREINQPEPVPANWHTSKQLCKMLKLSDSRVGELLRELLAKGKAERMEFRVAAAGTVRPVPHYRLKQ